MPEIYNELSYTVDLDKPIVKTVLYDLFVTTSKKAHKIALTLRRGGQDVPVSGSVTAALITHADMVTQNATGSVEGGKAIFAFPPSFYTQSGMFDLLIFVDDQDSHVPVFCGEGSMILGQTDALYDPDNIVPSLAELLAQIEATRDAAAEASSAASSANTAAATANSAASNANNKASAANTAAQTANTAAAKINGLTVSAAGLAAGAAPTAAVSETGGHKHIALGIPKGDTGETPNLTIGTVTTGSPTDKAAATLTGTPENPVLSLTIPQGKPGTGNGTVTSVNTVEPDAAGNVTLSADDVGALAAGGTAANASQLGGKAPEYYVQPRNLLDNSDFRNPINQRGQETYAVSSSGGAYSIDRWMLRNANLNVKTGTVTRNNGDPYIGQSIDKKERYSGKTLTLAVKIKSGEGTFAITNGERPIYYGTGLSEEGSIHGAGVYCVSARMPEQYEKPNLNVIMRNTDNTGQLTIEWVALYEGEYTTDNVPPYVPKGYAAELAECQRYCLALNYNGEKFFAGFGEIKAGGLVNAYFHLPVPMRVIPSLSNTDASGWAIKNGGESVTPTNVSVWFSSMNGILGLKFTVPENTNRGNIIVNYNSGEILIISAEL